MINEVDADGSGSIDFSEFLNMVSKKVEESSVIQDQTRRAFKVLATSGKGEGQLIADRHECKCNCLQRRST